MAPRKPFLLRTDPDVLDALQRWASDELRSVNGQIDFILRRALQQAGRMPSRRARRPASGPAPDDEANAAQRQPGPASANETGERSP